MDRLAYFEITLYRIDPELKDLERKFLIIMIEPKMVNLLSH
jgi:hypothetical protein